MISKLPKSQVLRRFIILQTLIFLPLIPIVRKNSFFLGRTEDIKGILKFINALQQAPNVILYGMVSTEVLAKELPRMDAFLICYDVKKNQSEGSSYHKVIKYLAYGRPIVSNNISAHADNLSILQPQNSMNQGSSIINVFQDFISDQKKYVVNSSSLKGYNDLLIKILN